MTDILFVSVSTPAVRQMVEYARTAAREHPDLRFHIYHLCGETSAKAVDMERLKADIRSSQLQVLDLMGADGAVTSAMTPDLMASRAQRVVVSGMGPVGTRLGGSDAMAGRQSEKDATEAELFAEYLRRCGPGDIASGMDMLLRDYMGIDSLPEPVPFGDRPGIALRDPTSTTSYKHLEDYIGSRDDWIDGRRIVALVYNGGNYPSDTSAALAAVADRIRSFANVVPVAMGGFGYEDTKELRSVLGCRPDVIVGFLGFRFISGPMGGSSTAAMEFIEDMDAPFLRPCFLTRSTLQEWGSRKSGFTTMEFMIDGFMPELDGGTCIFPVGMNEETETVPEWGITLSEIRPVPDRLERLAGKVEGLLRLRDLRNSDKRIAIIGYNYPPGEGTLFGGSFLDTLGSLSAILDGMISAGYTAEPMSAAELKHRFIDGGLLNGSDWSLRSDDMIRYAEGRAHPEAVDRAWGPQPGSILADEKGYMVPGIVDGNVFIGIQPPRGGGDADSKSYHDPYTPPHHQYLAFYEWVRDVFKADAIVHIGTHGTVEFLPGKENAMSGDCFPDLVMGDTPHFYIYYAGNPSEAMIAKRRSHASLVSYMSPPFVRSGLYGDLADLESLIAEYRESSISDPGRSGNIMSVIRERAERMRLPTDIDDLEHELDDMRGSLIPHGLHVFGKGLDDSGAEEFALQAMRFPHGGARPLEDILSERGTDDPEEEARSVYATYNRGAPADPDPEIAASEECEKRILESAKGCDEMAGLLHALDGGYTRVKLGGDLQRNPEILPTGYNIVQFDPNAIPTEAAFARGAEAAENTIRMYREEHDGACPRTVAIVMWGLETSRTQGATLGQILTYLGFRPKRSRMGGMGGLSRRFEPIPAEELGRPRIDVAVTICGFFRDMFSNIVTGLNELFAKLDALDEPDSASWFAVHTRERYRMLLDEGYPEEDARDLSRCRLFGPGEGLYGTGGITDAVNSSSWKEETELSDIFRRSMGHAYSLRYRGRDVPELMEAGHRDADIVTQMRDSVDRELIDLDHYYEFFGGLCKTVVVARGSKASMYVTDSSGPAIRTTDVKRSIEHGIRTRLLNPKWIDALLRTDYHGAQQISDRFENILGLAATTGAVDSGVFTDMEDVYIRDTEMRERLRRNNNWALMSMISRLSEASDRGYWKATEEQLRLLEDAYTESEAEAEKESDKDRRRPVPTLNTPPSMGNPI